MHDLDPKVILLVDHHAVLLTGIDGDRSGPIGIGNLTADQLAFDQELPINLGQLFDVDITDVVPAGDRVHLGPNRPLDTDPILVAATANEGKVGEVPRQANATADHDVRFRTGTPHPLAAAFGKLIEVRDPFHFSPAPWSASSAVLPDSSMRRSSSRISEARS